MSYGGYPYYGDTVNPDAWRDSYDAWKLRSPYDEYDYDEEREECEHEEYDLDILTGRADCYYCDHHWYLTDAQLKAHERHQRDYDRQMRREASWWWRLWLSLRGGWDAIKRQPFAHHKQSGFDDEIPF